MGTGLFAQLPISNIYMFSYVDNGENINLTDPVLLTTFNAEGYNNQPSFISPNEVYIVSNTYENDFTDIIKLDLQAEELYRVTATNGISEFSPNQNAVKDYFSCVRIEADGKTQSFWLYPKDHSNSGKRILETFDNIAYYQWLSGGKVAFSTVNDDQLDLHIGDFNTGKSKLVIENIGRCLKIDNEGLLWFVHKITETSWQLKTYDFINHKMQFIASTRPGKEDFEILSDGSILMGEGSKLFLLKPKENLWNEIDDLVDFGIENITRLAHSRNKLILVSTK